MFRAMYINFTLYYFILPHIWGNITSVYNVVPSTLIIISVFCFTLSHILGQLSYAILPTILHIWFLGISFPCCHSTWRKLPQNSQGLHSVSAFRSSCSTKLPSNTVDTSTSSRLVRVCQLAHTQTRSHFSSTSGSCSTCFDTSISTHRVVEPSFDQFPSSTSGSCSTCSTPRTVLTE
jgi:hypothetical protein